VAAIPKPFGRVPGAALIALTNSRQASCEMVGFRYSHTFDKVSNLLICLVRAIVRDVNGGPDPNVACARGETDRLPVDLDAFLVEDLLRHCLVQTTADYRPL